MRFSGHKSVSVDIKRGNEKKGNKLFKSYHALIEQTNRVFGLYKRHNDTSTMAFTDLRPFGIGLLLKSIQRQASSYDF